MKEELQDKLVEILGSIQAAAGKAGDFAMAQLPDIAQQYVVYGRAYTLAISSAAICIFCFGFWTVFVVNRRHREADKEFEKAMDAYRENLKANAYVSEPYRSRYFERSDVFPFQFIPFALGALLFVLSLSQTLLVWFAPKVWLLKEIASMVK